MQRLDIVSVCYNCGSDIALVIEDLRKGDFPLEKIRFIIVDNASADDSVERLKAIEGLDIKIIESPKNLGFGAGCNLAIKFLTAPNTLLLNPDVNLYANSITSLLAFSVAHPAALIWGGRTLNAKGNDDGKSAWREPSLRGIACWALFVDVLLKKLGRPIPDAYKLNAEDRYIRVDAISGCFFLIDTALLKKLNGFDQRFFMYSEEIDLCRRARALGAQPLSTTTAKIVHHGSQTLNSINKLNFLYFHKLKYAQKHWPEYKFKAARTLIRLATHLRIIAFSAVGIFKSSTAPEKKLWADFLKVQKDWRF